LVPAVLAEQQNGSGGALNPQEFKPFKVIGKEALSLSTCQ
jgi:hypothetical protein